MSHVPFQRHLSSVTSHLFPLLYFTMIGTVQLYQVGGGQKIRNFKAIIFARRKNQHQPLSIESTKFGRPTVQNKIYNLLFISQLQLKQSF
jgi:hypothetical protein